MSESIELLEFRKSHFNEKVRWALAWKGVPHRRRTLLPGPHAVLVKRLTGQTMVPVVRFGERIVPGSAAILDELERRNPEPPLYPADPAQRRRALEIQSWFDDQVGPLVRRALFSVLLDVPGYVAAIFAGHRSWPVRTAYRGMLPFVGGVMRRSMGITDAASIEAGFAATRKGLDFVAAEAGADGHLVGERFTVADLTAAALLALAVDVQHPDMIKPRPMPRSVQGWLARWADHPGAAWVLDRYRRFRPAG